MSNIRDEILTYFKPMQMVYLATSDGTRAFVRPMTLIYHQKEFFIATGSADAKFKQIKAKPDCQFCLTIKDDKASGYIRGSFFTEIIEAVEIKKEVADNFPFIKQFWQDPADPGYALLKLHVSEFEYLPIGEMLAEKFKF